EGRLHQVQDLYQHYLHRPIDPSGLVAWVGTLPRALPKEAITAGLLASAEYFIKSQNADPRAALHVTPLLEVGQAIQTPVGPGGGVVRAVGSDGAGYTLVIPVGALTDTQVITAIPLAALD